MVLTLFFSEIKGMNIQIKKHLYLIRYHRLKPSQRVLCVCFYFVFPPQKQRTGKSCSNLSIFLIFVSTFLIYFLHTLPSLCQHVLDNQHLLHMNIFITNKQIFQFSILKDNMTLKLIVFLIIISYQCA